MSSPYGRPGTSAAHLCMIVLSLLHGATALAQVPATVRLQPQNTACNQALDGQLTLSAAAPAGGLVVQLTSSAPNVIPAPAPVTVAAGATSAALRLPCLPPTQSQSVTITATAAGGSASGTVTILAPVLTSIALKPNQARIDSVLSVTTSFTAAVSLLGPAPLGGVIVTLLNSDATVIGIPATVTIPAGRTGASFDVRLLRAVPRSTGFTITATGLGSTRMIADTVRAPAPVRLVVAANGAIGAFIPTADLAGGRTATARVIVSQPAPSEGLLVALTSDNARITVPTTIRVPPGDTIGEALVPIPTVSAAERVRLSAASGEVTVTRDLTINAAGVSSINFEPRRVIGGETAHATVSLSSTARGGPVEVRLVSSDPAVVVVPPRVSIPDGTAAVSFPLTTSGSTREVAVRITALVGELRTEATLTVAPTSVTRVMLPTAMRGGTPVRLLLIAPDRHTGFTVSLSADSAPLLDLPATVRFAANESRKELTIASAPVVAPVRVRVTAALGPAELRLIGGGSVGKREIPVVSSEMRDSLMLRRPGVPRGVSDSMMLTPPAVTGITLSRTGIEGGAGEVLQGTVTLDGIAPAGFGRFVGLRSTVPAVVLTGVQFAPGASSGVFEVRANVVSADQTGLIEAFLQTDPRKVSVPIRVVKRR